MGNWEWLRIEIIWDAKDHHLFLLKKTPVVKVGV